jgi:hypothetical protein
MSKIRLSPAIRHVEGWVPAFAEMTNEKGERRMLYLSSHSCSGALWNFQVRLGPAMTLR